MEKKHQYQGLTRQEVEESRRLHGESVFTLSQRASSWNQFLEKFEDPIIRTLSVVWLLPMIAAGIYCWGSEAKGFVTPLGPTGTFFAVMFASHVGFSFEVKTNKAFDTLSTVNDGVPVKVIRDGNIRQISKKEIIVGDIVVLEADEEIPIDGHSLRAISLQTSGSTLTSKLIISKATSETGFGTEVTYPPNVVTRGATVVGGYDIMQMEKVSDATGYDKVYKGLQIKNDVETPLRIQLKGLAGVISKAGYTTTGATSIVLIVKSLLSDSSPGMPTVDIIAYTLSYFMVAITLIVVPVPEGLPMSVTLSSALSMNRMLKTNSPVYKMHVCETTGVTAVICTDKIGTLTQNQMQVYQTNFYNLKGQRLGEDELSNLIKEGIFTNSAAFLDFSEGKVKTLGNPTGVAPLSRLNGQHQNYLELKENVTILD